MAGLDPGHPVGRSLLRRGVLRSPLTLRLRMTARGSRRAAQETFADRVLVEVAADEDDAGGAVLAFLPGTLEVAVEDHVHALEDEAPGLPREGHDALAAQ